MLRTNLATRPFYNERLAHWLLGLLGAAVAVFTVLNVVWFLGYSGRQSGQAASAARDEAQARALTARAAEVRRRIDPKALQRVTEAASEANAIIDARAISWTALFNDIEATLPPNVMLTSVSPSSGRDGVTVRFIVLGRTVEGIDTFIERLEQTGRFVRVFPAAEELTDEGLYQTTILAAYRQPGPSADADSDRPGPAPASVASGAGPGAAGGGTR